MRIVLVRRGLPRTSGSSRTTASIITSVADSPPGARSRRWTPPRPASGGGVVDDALVDALVAAAREGQMRLAAPPLRIGLPNRAARRCRNDEKCFRRTDLVESLTPDGRLHDHAGAAAVWRVVDRVVHVVGPAPQIVNGDLDDAVGDRLARQRLSQRLEIVRKDRDDVNTHGAHLDRIQVQQAVGGIDLDEAVRQRHRGHDRADEGDQHLGPLPAAGRTARSPRPRCAAPRRPYPRRGPPTCAPSVPRADGRRTRRGPRSEAGRRCRRRTGCRATHLPRRGCPRRRVGPAGGRCARASSRRRNRARSVTGPWRATRLPGAKRRRGRRCGRRRRPRR